MNVEVAGIEQVLLADSYVLTIFRDDRDVVMSMEFTLASLGLGKMIPGRLVIPQVDEEEWHRDTGELSSLEQINLLAHHYYSGPERDGSSESPDIGCINSIRFADGAWHIEADWGNCRLRTKAQPRIVLSGQYEWPS